MLKETKSEAEAPQKEQDAGMLVPLSLTPTTAHVTQRLRGQLHPTGLWLVSSISDNFAGDRDLTISPQSATFSPPVTLQILFIVKAGPQHWA